MGSLDHSPRGAASRLFSVSPIGRVGAAPFSPSSPAFTASHTDRAEKHTHFGFETVTEAEKTERVAGVFSSVAESYDRMNDLMSFGWHRLWKYGASFTN